jgi:hypothetical protein
MLASRKALTGALAGLVFVGGVATSFNDAEARPRHRGAAIAAGIIGGLALGAIAASAARPAYAYPSYSYGYGGYYPPSYGYGYGYSPAYYGGGYVPVAGDYYDDDYYAGPVCYWQRRRVAVDPYTVVVRRVRVCR